MTSGVALGVAVGDGAGGGGRETNAGARAGLTLAAGRGLMVRAEGATGAAVAGTAIRSSAVANAANRIAAAAPRDRNLLIQGIMSYPVCRVSLAWRGKPVAARARFPASRAGTDDGAVQHCRQGGRRRYAPWPIGAA